MSNIKLIIEERATNVGNFLVGRLLPFRQKRMIGPFIFIDHMGPVVMSERQNVDVLPHPHIGLSTLTYLFEGSIMHRDSIGTILEITPGAVNWMTAGKGVVHSERTPEHLRQSKATMHGLQIWVALPKDKEDIDPQFTHIPENDIPTWQTGNLQFKLIAGSAFGKTSPVPVFSKLFMIEIKSTTKEVVNIGKHLYGEAGLYILEGSIESEGHIYKNKQLLVAKDSTLCTFTIHKNSTIYIFGGTPFAEERFIDWNFVSTSKTRIAKAKKEWQAQLFPKVIGDAEEFVPYPSIPKKINIKKR